MSDSTQLRVLIVDDHARFRAAAAELLRARGFEVVGEADCEHTALEQAERFAPDGVLLDIQLGETHGPELCARMLQRDPSLAVLLVSAHQHELGEEIVKQCGARGIISKQGLGRADLERFFHAGAPDAPGASGVRHP